jgi:hypothetical protein
MDISDCCSSQLPSHFFLLGDRFPTVTFWSPERPVMVEASSTAPEDRIQAIASRALSGESLAGCDLNWLLILSLEICSFPEHFSCSS